MANDTGRSWLYLLYFLLIKSLISAIPIDNGLAVEPSILCAEDRIGVDFRTINEFEGNLYVKGNFLNDECRRGGTGRNQVAILLPFETQCGLRRRRRAVPPGIIIETVLVIMFYQKFLTKVDRAYRIECFYMEADKIVTNSLDVSMLPTVPLSESISMPTCIYQVLRGGPLGAPVRFAQIGEPVYHKWTCSGGSEDMFCMTVHTCLVDDGQGQSSLLLDDNGCSQDRYLLLNLEYMSDLMAGRESHVFKFADRPTVFFNCQIRLALKESHHCIRSSDGCPQPRGKREINNSTPNYTEGVETAAAVVDVMSNLDVLDIQEKSQSELDPKLWESYDQCVSPNGAYDLCISTIGVGFLIALVAFLFFSILSFVCAAVSLRCRQCVCQQKEHHLDRND